MDYDLNNECEYREDSLLMRDGYLYMITEVNNFYFPLYRVQDVARNRPYQDYTKEQLSKKFELISTYVDWKHAERLERYFSEKMNRLKCYWIGEHSELYVGISIEDINKHCGDETMQENIDNGEYGVIDDLRKMIHDVDTGEALSISDIMDLANDHCPRQIGTSN